MLTVKSNLAEVSGRLVGRFSELTDVNGVVRDKLLRTVAVSMAADIRYRVHVEGKKADGSKLPQYSNSYLKQRQRKPYNRTSDTQMVFSLTRQMENDFGLTPNGGVVPTEDPIKTANGYGLGFKNKFNAEKADWLENGRKGGTVKAHTRKLYKTTSAGRRVKKTVKTGTGDKVQQYTVVREHTRTSSAGFGTVYGLTPQEKDRVREIAEEFIKGFNKKQF